MSGAEVLFAVFQPSNTILFLIALGALLLPWRQRLGAWMLGIGIVLFTAGGMLPVGKALIRPLEDAVPYTPLTAPPDAIIVLGGFIESRAGGAVPFNLNDNADRLTAAASLAHRYPGVPVVVSEGANDPADTPGAVYAADWLASVGVPRDQIVVEPRAQSTWDNAVFSKALIHPKPDGRYLVVTSAWHMPRSLAIFRAAGWPEPIPYPVDPMSGVGPFWWTLNYSVSEGLVDLDLAAREWSAIAWYGVRGRLSGFHL